MKVFVVVDKEFMDRATNAILEVEKMQQETQHADYKLKDIKETIESARKCIDSLGDIDYPRQDELILSIWDNGKLDWLIQQAERVQTLEFYKQDWMLVVEQNKRYREAIEEAFRELKYGDAFNAELILVEALEGEE